ncbi:hypothetical protein GOP47_0026330 [Adiantum capillus-veneris]|nr:hypothetical protein GOP47_0026330 [Adiantum capillus-veneris]
MFLSQMVVLSMLVGRYFQFAVEYFLGQLTRKAMPVVTNSAKPVRFLLSDFTFTLKTFKRRLLRALDSKLHDCNLNCC